MKMLLPSPGWLQENGHSALDSTMRMYPELFAHIPQDSKRGKTLQDWIVIGEKLAKKHGRIPSPKWLQQNHYNGLNNSIRRHPEAFAHIPQDHKRQSLEEHVATAEGLRRKHGQVPHARWLITNNYSGLYSAIQKHPAAFAHIPRDKKGRSLNENIALAEKLTRKHGKLPNPTWLTDNGYHGLNASIHQYPEAYSHISQDSKRGRSLEENIVVAEALMRRHGKLPNPMWLREHGYHGVNSAIKRHRDAFAHIPQASKKGRSVEENIVLAKKLHREHGQVPSHTWLIQNGYSGLDKAIRDCPKMFMNLQRTPYARNTA
jgi:hypothetical protein